MNFTILRLYLSIEKGENTIKIRAVLAVSEGELLRRGGNAKMDRGGGQDT